MHIPGFGTFGCGRRLRGDGPLPLEVDEYGLAGRVRPWEAPGISS